MGFGQQLWNGLQFGVQHYQFRALMQLDRESACDAISQLVEGMTEEQFDEYEQVFLTHAISVSGQPHRLRALELYAFLKMREVGRYGRFRGFVGNGGRLT
jgi:hypothetical protein